MKLLAKLLGIGFITIFSLEMSYAQPSVFQSDLRYIYVTEYTKVNANWDSLSGYGYTKLYNHSPAINVPVSFENIKVEQSGAEYFLRRGTVNATYIDTFNLNPLDVSNVLSTKVYYDSLIIGLAGVAHVKCRFSPLQVIGDDTLSYNVENWAKLSSSDYLLDYISFRDTSIQLNNSKFSFSNSEIFVKNNRYRPVYYGNYDYIFKEDTIRLTFNNINDISYFSASTSKTLTFTDQIDIHTTSCLVDISNTVSPEIFNDSILWKGIYLNNLGVNEIKQDSTFAFKITEDLYNTVKRDSSAWLAYITNEKLVVDLDTTFKNPLFNKYNYFDACYSRIKINNLNDTLEWNVTGNVYIPYLDNYYDITIPCKDGVIQLAEKCNVSDFEPFPLYEFELKEFALIMFDGMDTIWAEIDYDNNELEISLPVLETEYDSHQVYPWFNISAHNIMFNYMFIISGSQGGWFLINSDDSFDLKIASYNNEIKNYLLNVDVEETVSTEKRVLDDKIKVYPNPVQDLIKVSGLSLGSDITLLDIDGKILLKQSSDKETEILDISKYENGVYILKIENKEAYFSEKILKL